jgi:hypothetical protein
MPRRRPEKEVLPGISGFERDGSLRHAKEQDAFFLQPVPLRFRPFRVSSGHTDSGTRPSVQILAPTFNAESAEWADHAERTPELKKENETP